MKSCLLDCFPLEYDIRLGTRVSRFGFAALDCGWMDGDPDDDDDDDDTRDRAWKQWRCEHFFTS